MWFHPECCRRSHIYSSLVISQLALIDTLSSAGIGYDDSAVLSIGYFAFHGDPIWRELIPRLVPSELLPDDPELIEKIVAQ